MIPVLIVFGLVLGKWWYVAIPVGAAWWTITIVNAGTLSDHGIATVFTVAMLGAGNTAVGAAVNRGVARPGRRLPDEGRWPKS